MPTVDPEINLPLNDAFSLDDWQRIQKINEKRTSTCQEHPTDRETQTMTSEARHYWVGHPPGGRYPPERIGDLGSAWIDRQVDEWMDEWMHMTLPRPIQPVNCDHLTYRRHSFTISIGVVC